jgi:hypothetical protein
MYALRGLGATPPPTILGYDWFSFNQPRCVDVEPALKQKYGCVVHDGVAWGKMPKAQAELQEGGPTPQEFCAAMYDGWARDNPNKARCLSAHDKAALIAGCMQVVAGEITQEYAVQQINAIVAQRCGPIYERECTNDMQAWAQINPEAAQCLGADGAEQVMGWCMQNKHGILSTANLRDALDRLVAARCAAEPEITPAPPPPDAGTLPGDPVDMPPGMPAGGGDWENGTEIGPGDTTPTETTRLRQLGPIIGIGLLLAVGLTLATRKRKRKR